MTTWQDYLRERELERQIAAGETPLDVVLYFGIGVCAWIGVIAYVVWGMG